MKILNPSQISQLDLHTIQSEPISSIDLMERASRMCFEWLIKKFDTRNSFTVFAGVGNNGGDALAISRMLIEYGYRVNVYLVEYSQNYTGENLKNQDRLKDLCKLNILEQDEDLNVSLNEIILDGIFGIGLKREPQGFVKDLIALINNSDRTVVSIDIPSGLFANAAIKDFEGIVKSHYLLTFHCPKLSLFLADSKYFVKQWHCIDIGLDKSYAEDFDSFYHYIQREDIKKIYKKRERFSHKGSYGHSMLVGGSSGKIGAILLATKAAVKSGSGLVTALIPKCGYNALQTSVPEAMVLTEGENYLERLYYDINPNAIAIGPGLGTVVGTHRVLKDFLTDNKIPLVLDADALNLLSTHKELLAQLPEGSVLTPHPVEFERLVGKWSNSFEKLKLASEFALNYQVVIVLKDAYTAIVDTNGEVYFNSTGNAALATGGSGDVLSGIICSLISQGYNGLQASVLGVYLHGLAADLAMDDAVESSESFSAMDIISYLGRSFNKVAAY